jgi:hypothetical protein
MAKRQKTRRRKRTYKKRYLLKGGNVPSFHIFIPSIGRPTLKKLLDSLKPQLQQQDAVTIVFDGPEAAKKGFTQDWLNGFICKTNVITHPVNINKWSHGIANEYLGKLTPETTFLMNADDDDFYTPNAFSILRQKCTKPQCLYIARMNLMSNPSKVYPDDTWEIRFENIGTPNGIIPFKEASKVKWGLRFGGDFDYYQALSKVVPCIEHIPEIIYTVDDTI